jgi:hypothetical protein
MNIFRLVLHESKGIIPQKITWMVYKQRNICIPIGFILGIGDSITL